MAIWVALRVAFVLSGVPTPTSVFKRRSAQLRQLIIDLDNLDATLRLFVPDIDLEEIKPKPFPPRNAAVRGELSRIVLSLTAPVVKAAHGARFGPACHG